MKYQLIKNSFILGISGFFTKSFDFLFRSIYSQWLGKEGMGLLSLGFSIHGVMLTVSTAGLGIAVSKIVSEYLFQKEYGAIRETMKMALFTVVLSSCFLLLIVWIRAEWISENIVGDIRVASGLCCLIPSILFMGVSYCIKGYFYAIRRVNVPALSEFVEQIVKGIFISLLLKVLLQKGVEYGCCAIFLGITLGELSSCIYLCIFFFKEIHLYPRKSTAEGTMRNILQISFPAMLTSLVTSLFRMQEEVWIVSALKRSGMNQGEAVSNLGILYGMVTPLLIFPVTLMSSVSTLLIPEVSRRNSMKDGKRMQGMIKKTYLGGLMIGVFLFVVLQIFPKEVCQAIYHDSSIALYLKRMSFICPFMIIESLSRSFLNGMGEQVLLLYYSLLDSVIRLCGIYFGVPVLGMNFLIGIIIFSNLLSCLVSAFTILQKTKRKG